MGNLNPGAIAGIAGSVASLVIIVCFVACYCWTGHLVERIGLQNKRESFVRASTQSASANEDVALVGSPDANNNV